MISLILSAQLRRHLTRLAYKHVCEHTPTRAHTRPFVRGYAENGSSNLSPGLGPALYSNCSRDSWQKPRGIAKEHPLSVLPSLWLHLSTSTILVINFLPRLPRWCVYVCVCYQVFHYVLIPPYSLVCLCLNVSAVFLNSKEALSQVAQAPSSKDTRCSRRLRRKFRLYWGGSWERDTKDMQLWKPLQRLWITHLMAFELFCVCREDLIWRCVKTKRKGSCRGKQRQKQTDMDLL